MGAQHPADSELKRGLEGQPCHAVLKGPSRRGSRPGPCERQPARGCPAGRAAVSRVRSQSPGAPSPSPPSEPSRFETRSGGPAARQGPGERGGRGEARIPARSPPSPRPALGGPRVTEPGPGVGRPARRGSASHAPGSKRPVLAVLPPSGLRACVAGSTALGTVPLPPPAPARRPGCRSDGHSARARSHRDRRGLWSGRSDARKPVGASPAGPAPLPGCALHPPHAPPFASPDPVGSWAPPRPPRPRAPPLETAGSFLYEDPGIVGSAIFNYLTIQPTGCQRPRSRSPLGAVV